MKDSRFQCDVAAGATPDYEALRQEFLALIQGYSGGVWTDHNTHDPGLTLGEHLCFGLTDATYVAGLPVADLLVPDDKQPAPPSPDFPAHRVLPARSLTALDYRKLLIDQEGVRNAWIEIAPAPPPPAVYVDEVEGRLSLTPPTRGCPLAIRGFYHVLVEFEDHVPVGEWPERLAALKTLLEGHRNLCEEFLSVEAIPIEEVGVCAEIRVTDDANLDEVAAQAFLALEQHLAPPLRFHSLEEELARGTSPEVLFDGPLLLHGFLDDDEVEAAARPVQVQASDLVRVLMDIPGVVAVGKVIMTSFWESGDAQEHRRSERWVLPLQADRAARLSVERCRLLFFKRELPFMATASGVSQRLRELRALQGGMRHPPSTSELPVPRGRRRELERFETLLNLLPLNYGVGLAGLSPQATPERQAQARQLKAFFLLAEALLSGHRDQVARLPELLSLLRHAPVLSAKPPADLQNFAAITGHDETGYAEATRAVIEPELERLRRRNAIADHLLARFAEPFDPYLLLGTDKATRTDPWQTLTDKLRLLAALPELARDRAAAVNLALDPSAAGAGSGLERKLHVLLGTAPALAGALEFYEEKDQDNRVEWRFRIRHPGGKILLSSSRHYLTRTAAEAEAAVVARSGPLAERYRGAVDRDGRFYFNLADESGEIIARRIEFFGTEAERDTAISACVNFFKGLPPEFECHLLEHVLLRPRDGASVLLPICHPQDVEAGKCPCDDPYSFRCTLVLPAWTGRVYGIYRRAHFERLVRELVPAHVFLKICWVSREQMREFREALTAWRLALIRGPLPALARAQDTLISVWLNLRSQFPPATLHDCVDGNDDNPVVLDKTQLGTLLRKPPS